MTPEAIVACITAVANAVTEGFKYAQTPAGQQAIQKMTADQAAFQQGLKDAVTWLEKFFTGKLG